MNRNEYWVNTICERIWRVNTNRINNCLIWKIRLNEQNIIEKVQGEVFSCIRDCIWQTLMLTRIVALMWAQLAYLELVQKSIKITAIMFSCLWHGCLGDVNLIYLLGTVLFICSYSKTSTVSQFIDILKSRIKPVQTSYRHK